MWLRIVDVVPGEPLHIHAVTAHGELTGTWRGIAPPQIGVELFVTVTVPEPVPASAVQHAGAAAAGLSIAGNGGTTVRGTLHEGGRDGLVVLEVGDRLIPVVTDGGLLRPGFGEIAEITVDDLDVRPH